MNSIARKLQLHPQFVMPAYGRQSIAEVPGTIRHLLNCKPTGQTLPKSWFSQLGNIKTIILLIVDGLGYEQFMTAPSLAGLRARGSCKQITSLFPSTTPVCLTSLFTGGTAASLGIGDQRQYLPPEEFGGGRGRLAKLIPFTSEARSLKDHGFTEADIFNDSSATIFEALSEAEQSSIMLSPYAGDPYSNRIQRGISQQAYIPDAKALMSGLLDVTSGNKGFNLVVGYYPNVDQVGHAYGPGSAEQSAVIENFGSLLTQTFLGQMNHAQAESTLLMITADHGQMLVDQDMVTYLDAAEYAWLADRLQNDGAGGTVPLATWSRRCPALYIRPELVDDTVLRLRKQLRGRADVVRVTDALAAGLYGSPEIVSSRFLGRAGTVLILPHPGHCVWERGKDKKGTHGGLSSSEMQVPFFFAPLVDLIS